MYQRVSASVIRTGNSVSNFSEMFNLSLICFMHLPGSLYIWN